jgi:hypothetical protein
MLAIAAGQFPSRPGELALVGFTDAVATLQVPGGQAVGPAHAVLVEPVHPRSADSLSAAPARTRLVSNLSAPSGEHVDVYELDLPPGLTGHVALTAAGARPWLPASIDVYDWTQRAWRPPPAPGAVLDASASAQGAVLLRVRELGVGQTQISLRDSP